MTKYESGNLRFTIGKMMEYWNIGIMEYWKLLLKSSWRLSKAIDIKMLKHASEEGRKLRGHMHSCAGFTFYFLL